MGTEKEIVYVEPIDFFPKELREKYKLGEFAEDEDDSPKADDDVEKSDNG